MPKSKPFGQKEDQFRSLFSKRSNIRPRSDKTDLLGNTADAGGAGGAGGSGGAGSVRKTK